MSFGTQEASLYIGVPLLFLLVIGMYVLMQYLNKIPLSAKPIRWNAFQLPWDQWQVLAISWVVYSAFVFWAVAMPALTTSDEERDAMYALHGILFGTMVLLWLFLSFDNPSINGTSDEHNDLGAERETMYCDKCSKYFNGRRRKHCRHCHKCVIDYDHHCFFLNTCVSNHNYKAFFVTLTVFNLVNVVQFSVTFGALAGYHAGNEEAVQHAQDVVGEAAFCIFNYCLLLAGLPGELGAAALLGLHCYLCATSITTFEWLGSRYEEERIKRRLMRERGDNWMASTRSQRAQPAAPPPESEIVRTKRHSFVRRFLPCIAQADEVGKLNADGTLKLENEGMPGSAAVVGGDVEPARVHGNARESEGGEASIAPGVVTKKIPPGPATAPQAASEEQEGLAGSREDADPETAEDISGEDITQPGEHAAATSEAAEALAATATGEVQLEMGSAESAPTQ